MLNSDSVQPTAGPYAVLIPLGAHASVAPIPIKRPLTLIGSRKNVVRLHLDSSTVSKAHCVIVLNDWGCYVRDLGSRTHTWVNGQQVSEADLRDGDTLQIGRFQFKYVAPRMVREKLDVVPAELVVSTLSDPLQLDGRSSGRVVQIGRRPGSDLQFDDPKVSNVHALMFAQNGQWLLRDLGSRTGVWVGGRPVRQETLDDGSLIRIGAATLTFRHRHLDTELDDEYDLAAPVTLDKAIAPHTPDLVDDFASPPEAIQALATQIIPEIDANVDAPINTGALDTGSLDTGHTDAGVFNEVVNEPLDLADLPTEEPFADGDAIPSADALASLRRGWRAPATGDAVLPASPSRTPVSDLAQDFSDSPPRPSEPPAAPTSEAAPLGDDAVADLLADVDAVPEPVDLADLIAETPASPAEAVALVPDSPAGPSRLADVADAQPSRFPPVAAPPAPRPLPQPLEVDEDGLAVDQMAAEFSRDPDHLAADDLLTDLTEAPAGGEPAAPATAAADASAYEPSDASAPEATVAAPAAEPSDKFDIEDFDLDLEPLELDETASADLLTEITPEVPFPADAAVAESVLTADPTIDDLIEDVAASDSPVARDAEVSVAEPPAEFELEDLEDLELDLEPLALDDNALAVLPAAPVAEAAFPVDDNVAEAASRIDPKTNEPAAPVGEQLVAEQSIAEPPFDIDDLKLEPLDLSVADILAPAEPVADAAAAPAATHVEPPVETTIEAVIEPRVDESASETLTAEEPQAVDDLADMEFDLDPSPANEAPATPPERFGATSIEILDEPSPDFDRVRLSDDEPLDETASDTAMALDLSAFIDADEDEHEWEDALPPAEPVMEIGEEELPPPQGGSLRDLIPDNPPLIGGMFTPEGPTMIGGSPVINFNAPPPRDSAARRKPLRVGFGGRSTASPFAGGQSNTIADVMIGGGAAAASIDVFATPSPTADELAAISGTSRALVEPTLAPVDDDAVAAESFVETAAPLDEAVESPSAAAAEEDEIRAVADLFRPRSAPAETLENGQQVSPFGQAPITSAHRPEDDPAHAAQVRRSRYRRIIACLIATLPLAAGGIFGVYHYVQPYTEIDADITYDGLDRLGTEDAANFRASQNVNLQSDQLRQKAIMLLPPETSYGFLKDDKTLDQAINRDPTVRWPRDPQNVMRLQMRSVDKAADLARMKALAQALITVSDADRSKSDADNLLIDNDTFKIKNLKRKLEDVDATLQDIQQAGNARPDLKQIALLQDNRKTAEAALTSIKSSRQELEAQLQVLQRPESVALPPQTAVDAARSDEALAALSIRMADLQKQSDADKAEAASRSAAARKTLDDSIAQFQKDLQGAQQLKQSPELAAYVDAANRIFIETRELTEDLLRREENQRTRQIEMKARLADKIEARTKEMLEKDEQLKKLRQNLDISTRQYNAALAQGDDADAKKMELNLQLVHSLIAAREDLYKNDPVYSEATQQYQAMIDETEKTIIEDRKHIDDRLTKVQAEFSKTAPVVEKLPDEQKALADAVEKKLEAVNNARKAYDLAADEAQTAQGKIEIAQKEKAAALQLEIAARKQEVLDAAQAKASRDTEVARQQKLDATQQQLVVVRASELKAQQELDSISNAIDNAEKQRRAFVDSDLVRNEKQAEKQRLERELKDTQASIDAHSADRAKYVVPDPKFDIVTFDQPDHRPIYAAGVGGGLFALMMLPVLWTLMLTTRDAHHGHPPRAVEPNEPSGQGFDPIVPDAFDESDAVASREHAAL